MHGKAIIYLRVSTHKQVLLGESLENQEKSCLEWCYRNQILPLQTFKDEGRSAKTLERPEMQRMLTFINNNHKEINFLIVYQIDRLSRFAPDYFEIAKALGSYNIQLRDASEALESGPANDLVRGINALMAEFDNRIKSQRVLDNMKQAASKGYRMHKAPYGLKNIRDKDGRSDIEPVPAVATKIADALNRFSTGLYTKTELVRYCNDIGLPQPNAKPMSIQLFDKIVKNPIYAGLEKSTLTDDQYIDSVFDGIISKETFFENQNILNSGEKLKGRYKILNPDYILRGFVTCDSCGHKLTGSASTGRGGKKYPGYTCRTKSCKNKGYIHPDELHEQFEDILSSLQPTPKKLELLKTMIIRKWSQQAKDFNKEKLALQSQAHDIENKLLATTEKLVSEDISRNEHDQLRSKYESKRLELENRLAAINKKLIIKKDDINYAVDYIGKTARLWHDAAPDMKVTLQNMVFNEGISYDFKKRQFGTAKLSAIYTLANIKKDSPASEKSMLVIPRGIEPLLPG